MKKYLMILLTAGIAVFTGCAEEETPEAFIPADVTNTDSLVGSYRIDYISIQDHTPADTTSTTANKKPGTYIVSNNCDEIDVPKLKDYNCDRNLQILSQRASIEKFVDAGRVIYGTVIQMQLSSGTITSTYNEDAYHHIIFPIQGSYFTNGFGRSAVTKATDRGVSIYFVNPPNGTSEKVNFYINEVSNSANNQIQIKMNSNDGSRTYIFRMTKTSNTSGSYISMRDPGPAGGLYATSSIKNTPLLYNFSDATLTMIFTKLFKIMND